MTIPRKLPNPSVVPLPVALRRFTYARRIFLLESVDLLTIGSPTQGGRATLAIQNFLDGIPEPTLRNMHVATFATRLPTRLVGIFGYAAGKIAESLKTKGGILIVSPEGFIVKGKEGPLKDGEEERAAEWAKVIFAACRAKSQFNQRLIWEGGLE